MGRLEKIKELLDKKKDYIETSRDINITISARGSNLKVSCVDWDEVKCDFSTGQKESAVV